jgi:hypothetical protein
MAEDLKAATPDASLPEAGFLFGADSQSAASPSVYSTPTVRAAILQSSSGIALGADAASPTAQAISAPSVLAGTTNTAGANLTLAGGAGTGMGTGGSVQLQVAFQGSTGSTQNPLTTGLRLDSAPSGSAPTAIVIKNNGNGPVIYNSAGGALAIGSGYATPSLYISSGTVGIGGTDVVLAKDASHVLAQRLGVNAQTFRVYATYTDASNYERMAITGSAITVETAGTGADNIDLTLTPAGTGVLKFGTWTSNADAAVNGYITVKDAAGNSRKLATIA